MLAIDLCDEVEVLAGEDEPVSEHSKGFRRTSLTDQALSTFRNKVRAGNPIKAAVRKKIPIAAGLGGGSSNAATALLAANQLTGQALANSELAEIAIRIGSDVPFFLKGGCALVSGRGEIRNRDLPIPNVWIVLANPGVELPTPTVFGELQSSDFTSGARTRVLAASLAAGQPRWDLLHNGLQAVAERLCLSIREVLAVTRAHTPWTLLSGSGATCFGIFESEESAQAAERELARAGYWTWTGRPLKSWTIADLKT